MSSATSSVPTGEQLQGGRRLRDRLGDRLLYLVTLLASLAAVGLIVLIAWKIVYSAHLALSKFGISFLWGMTWDTNHAIFGAAPVQPPHEDLCTTHFFKRGEPLD